MDSLKHLKDLSEFKGIRISERAMIKEYQEEAKNRNNADPNADIVWKVRGTPKNGLIFKWFKKATQAFFFLFFSLYEEHHKSVDLQEINGKGGPHQES